MQKKYDTVVSDFEKAVIQMQKDLEYMANRDQTPSPQFFDKQNRIISALIDYHQRTQAYTKYLENEASVYQTAKRKQLKYYEDRIISFEAICIIHGIIDFPMWMSMGKQTLIDQAIFLGKNKKMRLSNLMNTKLDNLPLKERESILSLLQKDLNTELKKLFKRLTTKKKESLLLNETRTQRNKTQF